MAGGTNEKGFNFTYKVLDWGNRPMRALVYAFVLTAIIAPLCHVMVYGLYRLRVWTHRKYACSIEKHKTIAKTSYKDAAKNARSRLFKSYSLKAVFAKNGTIKKS